MKRILKKKVRARLYDYYLDRYESPVVFMEFTRWQWNRIRIRVVT